LDQKFPDHLVDDGLFETIIASAQEVVIVTDGDLDSPEGPSIRLINPAAERLTGYSKDELVGRRLRSTILADRWPAVIAELERSRDSGKPQQSELFSRDAGGKDLWIDISTIPIFGAGGKLDYFVRIGRDITARKRADRQRETTQRLLASVFSVIEYPLIVTDDGLVIHMTNIALGRQLGWSVSDTIGKPLDMILSEVDKGIFESLAASAVLDQPKHFRADFRHKNGSKVCGTLDATLVKQPGARKFFIIKLTLQPAILAAEQDFERRLRDSIRRAGGSAMLVAGKLQLVDLEAVREKLGPRWHDVSSRAMEIAERVIRRYLQPQDICRKSGSDGFLVFFDQLNENDAQFKARAIGIEIRERLLGELPEAGDGNVASLAASVEISESDAASAETVIDALRNRLESESRRREAKAHAAAVTAFKAGKALFQYAQSAPRQPAPIAVTRPPRPILEAVDTLLSLGQASYGLEMEVFLLTGAGERLLAGQSKSNSELLIVPMRFATTANARDFEAWLTVARTLGDPARRQVAIEITDIPRDTADTKLADLSMRLSTLFRTTVFELPGNELIFVTGLPVSTRLATIPARRITEDGTISGPLAERLHKMLNARSCRLIVKDVPAPGQAKAIFKLGCLILPAADAH
jgi:PAS domain S-box-containing protein